MTRRLLLWPLVLLLPFAGIRMVCVELPGHHVAAAAGSDAKCDETCPLPKPRDPNAPVHDTSAGTGCMLFADGSIHLLVSGPAVLPAPPPPIISFAERRLEPDADPFYFGPALTHGTPPPKS